jgi:hypothetical protein
MCELLVSRLLELDRRHWPDEVKLARHFEQDRFGELLGDAIRYAQTEASALAALHPRLLMGPAPAPSTLFESTQPIEVCSSSHSHTTAPPLAPSFACGTMTSYDPLRTQPPRYDAIDARYSALGRVRTYLETAARAPR